MPAFGKNGMINLNQKEPETTYMLCKPDGTVIMSSNNQANIDAAKENMSKQLNCELHIKTSTMRCI